MIPNRLIPAILTVVALTATAAAQPVARFENFQNFGGELNHELAVAVRVQVPGAAIYDVVGAHVDTPRPLSAFRFLDIQSSNSDHFQNVSGSLLPNQNPQPTDGLLDIESADLNLDGYDDLVLLRQSATQGNFIFLSLWDSVNQEYSAEQQIAQGTFELIHTTDINQDGYTDILVIDGTSGWGPFGSNPTPLDVGLFLSNLGTFSPTPTVIAQIPNTVSGRLKLVSGDTDGDNDIDLIAQASLRVGMAAAQEALFGIDQTSGAFSVTGTILVSVGTSGFFDLVVEDIDQNGTAELIASTVTPTSFSILRFFRQGVSWTSSPLVPVTPAVRPGVAMSFADYNNDGKKDLIAVSRSTGLLVYRQTTAGAFINSTSTALPGLSLLTRTSSKLLVADFNQDGFQDILAPLTPVGGALFLGNGTTFSDASLYHGISNRYGEFPEGQILKICSGKILGNFENLVMVHQKGAYIARGDGSGDFKNVNTLTPTTGLFTTCALLDADGDGDKDIFMASESDISLTIPSPDENYILINNGNGTFTKNLTIIPQQVAGRIVVAASKADLNNDSREDLVLVTSTANRFDIRAQIYTNTTQGFQMIQPTSPANRVLLGLEVGDFNGDGLQEPVVSHTDGNGNFSQDIFYRVGGGYVASTVANLDRNQLIVADFNGDARDDLLMLSSDPANLPVIYSSNTTYTPVLPPISCTAAHAFDANGDGLLDVALFVPRLGGSRLQYLINSGSAFSVAPGNLQLESQVIGLNILDLDEDGDLDMVNFELDTRYIDGYSQPKAFFNPASQLIATRTARVGGPGGFNITIEVANDLPSGIVAVFASLAPLTPGISTPFGNLRLVNFVSGPMIQLAGPMSLARTVVSLPATPSAANQIMTLQGIVLSPSGQLKLTNPQTVELLP